MSMTVMHELGGDNDSTLLAGLGVDDGRSGIDMMDIVGLGLATNTDFNKAAAA